MKKLLLIIGICVLLVGMPATTAMIPLKAEILKTQLPTTQEPIATIDFPPDWANGNFTGVWGLNIWGKPLPPVGWLAGYYSYMRVGRFLGVFDVFNETNASGYIGGIFFGPFMFGKVGNISSGNETGFVGIGGHNETHFYWRIMGIAGPTFYMYGIYSKFNN